MVSQLTYPTFLRKVFVSVYLPCMLAQVSDITNLCYNKIQLIFISNTRELYEVPSNKKGC